MRIAGHLHDLGKLAVPAEILEKPSALSEEEFSVIRGHTFYTQQVLESMGDLGPITEWAAAHHERMDGSGYPSHEEMDDLSLGARIISVADVFTALTEDRPYRKGMERDEALEVLQEMADTAVLDGTVVSQLRRNFDDINDARIAAQKVAKQEYDEMVSSLSLS
jgi:HD-GYP domain-containing protein (c-di-GMP phosphodiesterase class II)